VPEQADEGGGAVAAVADVNAVHMQKSGAYYSIINVMLY